MNVEGMKVLDTLEGCEEVWTVRAAELFCFHLN